MGCGLLSSVRPKPLNVMHETLMEELRNLKACTFLNGSNFTNDKKYKPAFENWSGNIESSNVIHYPHNDAAIIQLIAEAKATGGKIKVVGTGHSATPVVCGSHEIVKVICLAQYSMAPIVPDYEVDATGDFGSVTVNCGWNLDQMFVKLGIDAPDYIMEAQTAGRIFSIGGLINMCRHGGCMKSGLIADTVTMMRVINSNGEVIHVSADEELKFYRMSMGVLGVVTHAKLSLRKINELKIDKQVGVKIEMTEEWFKQFFTDKISSDAIDAPLFQQIFFNFFDMEIYYCGWIETDQKRTSKDYPAIIHNRSGARGIGGAPHVPLLDEILDVMDLNYRGSTFIVSRLVKTSCKVPSLAWDLNVEGENDAFWVSSLPVPMPASHWTAWMVPLQEDDPTLNIYRAVRVAYEKFMAVEAEANEGRSNVFRPDVALEARFINSSDSYMAPCYSVQRYSQLYFVCEQPTLCSNLYLSRAAMRRNHESDHDIIALNKSYRKYFADLEEGWKAIDDGKAADPVKAKPHLAKVFGFGPADEDDDLEPFNKKICGEVLSDERKAKMNAKIREVDESGIFSNEFTKMLLT